MKPILLLLGLMGSGFPSSSQQILTGAMLQTGKIITVRNPMVYRSPAEFLVNRKGVAKPFGLSGISSQYYLSQIGFFCKREIQLQEITHCAIKFRLGSVEYTDYLEGKESPPGWIP